MGRSAWAAAALPGEAVAWQDSPAMGPWSPDPHLRIELRAKFWGVSDGSALREEEAVLRSLLAARGAVLWFSAEPWDQLAQLWVVARLTREDPSVHLELAHLKEGGCRVPPATLEKAFTTRSLLAREDRELTLRLWDQFEAEDWPGLWKWLHKGGEVGSMPFLPRALARVLEDRPPHVPGRTERQVRDLQACGVRDLSGMMKALAALEAPYGLAWYGDLVVRKLMEPAISGR
jgi:hypothetical protein